MTETLTLQKFFHEMKINPLRTFGINSGENKNNRCWLIIKIEEIRGTWVISFQLWAGMKI